MDKGKVSERVTKEKEFEDDCYIHLLVFTAGAAVLMACLKRVLVVFLLEEWRAWVFLFLNLVLLAILSTSTLSKSKETRDCQREDNGEVKITDKNKKVRKPRSKCRSEEQVVAKSEDSEECQKISGRSLSSTNDCRKEDIEPARLSKEELNERAEAFILMFRQHLVSDARKCGKEYYLYERAGQVSNLRQIR